MNWNQLKTILWLRWRLSRNQWSRGGQINAVLTMIITAIGLGISVIGGIAGVLIGSLAMAKVEPATLLLIWDIIILAFSFFWLIGLISEIQRSETIDIGRMLHLPVFLRDIFIINYLTSHFTPSVVLFLPVMLGLSIGLFLGKSWLMIFMLPLVLGFVFMISAWTYCLRGWLVTLMVNKRRRRAIIAGITFGFILIFQLPNLLGQFMHNHHRPKPNVVKQNTGVGQDKNKLEIPGALLIAHRYVPILWVGNGAMTLAQGKPLSAVLCAAGAFAIGGLGLRRAYRSTIRFYQGQATGKVTTRKPKAKKVVKAQSNFIERQLPCVSNEASAMGLAFLRSIMRAPEIKMMLGTNLLIFLIIGGSMLLRHSARFSEAYKPFVATGAIVVTFFGMSQLMFNLFGADRIGFRMLVLTPVRRERILLGKNLAYLPIALFIGLILLILVKFIGHIPVLFIFAATLQLIAAFFLLSMVGNLVSVLVPFRIAPGSMKPTKNSTLTTLLIIVSHMMFPVTMAPMFIAPITGLLFSKAHLLPAGPTNLIVSAVLLALILFAYNRSLPSLGKLLQQREKKILEVVTREVE